MVVLPELLGPTNVVNFRSGISQLLIPRKPLIVSLLTITPPHRLCPQPLVRCFRRLVTQGARSPSWELLLLRSLPVKAVRLRLTPAFSKPARRPEVCAA